MQELNKLLSKHSDKVNYNWSNILIQQIQSACHQNTNVVSRVFSLTKVLEFSTQGLLSFTSWDRHDLPSLQFSSFCKIFPYIVSHKRIFLPKIYFFLCSMLKIYFSFIV